MDIVGMFAANNGRKSTTDPQQFGALDLWDFCNHQSKSFTVYIVNFSKTITKR